jgi:hypothetical protein
LAKGGVLFWRLVEAGRPSSWTGLTLTFFRHGWVCRETWVPGGNKGKLAV